MASQCDRDLPTLTTEIMCNCRLLVHIWSCTSLCHGLPRRNRHGSSMTCLIGDLCHFIQ